MFLKNHVTKFNLNQIPEVLKRGWELEHGGGHITLVSLQNFAQGWIKFCLYSTLFCLIAGVIIFPSIIGSLPNHPRLLDLSTGGWLIGLLSILTCSVVWWIIILYAAPPARFKIMEDFICEYKKLMKLLNHDWGYQFQYPTGGPGVRADFEKVEPFVRERLVKLAARIKELESREVDWSDCIVDLSDPKELRVEFGRAFDILKPFGLVYPTYDPYFDPEGSYFYG